MRVIDADALLPNGVFYVDVDNPMKGLDELLNRIVNAPILDCAPVKHGEFGFYRDNITICPFCGGLLSPDWVVCPHCSSVERITIVEPPEEDEHD